MLESGKRGIELDEIMEGFTVEMGGQTMEK